MAGPGLDRLDIFRARRTQMLQGNPGDPGEQWMRCRHGSLTPAEMLVPLLASRR